MDPGMRFWLRFVEDRGGLWERAADRVLVVLPPELADRHRLPEELLVTGDPDIAREDGATFLGGGHPVLTESAESVLGYGDAGLRLLDSPESARPPDEVLLDHARTQLPVGHGRIDRTGLARPVTRWVLRVGALASYTVSAEDLFQEQIERWVDVGYRRELPADLVDRLARAPVAEKDQWPPVPSAGLLAAVGEADRLIEAEALRRRTALSRQLGDAHERERERADSYYADVIAGVERRLATATPDRRALLADRLAAIREEQARRLAEIAEKHQARHNLRPYRLHLVGVPAVRLPVDVRRGERRYPLELDWLAPAGRYAEPRCPSCDRTAPLVAGKSRLGCLACLTPAAPARPVPVPVPVPRPAPGPQPDPVPSRERRPAAPRPAARTTPAATPTGATLNPPIAPPVPAARPAPSTRRAGRWPATTPARVDAPRPVPPKRAENLAGTIWHAVAERRTRRLRDVIAPGSPVAALCRLYGADGPAHAIGIPPDEELTSFTSGSAWLTGGSSGYTAGVVQTDQGRYPYALHWHAQGRLLSVVEVLTYPPHPDGRMFGLGGMFLGSRRLTWAPVDVPGLDEVARRLLSVGVPRQGLGVTARALAAWWRLGGDELIAHDQPAVVAAAVHRLVAGRAGDQARFREAAGAYRVDEAALRRVDAVVRKQLALGPDRAW